MAKRNGEGWIKVRKDGRYSVGLHVSAGGAPGPDGSLKRVETTKRTYDEAAKWLNQKKHERDGGRLISSENPRLSEYLTAWLEESVKGQVSVRTYRFYRTNVGRHILPELGNTRLRSLTPRQVQSLYAQKREEGLALKTRRDIHTTLGKALRQAVAWGELGQNPTEHVKLPKAHSEGKQVNPFSVTDLRAIGDAAKSRRIPALCTFAAATGLRGQEIAALTWDDLTLPERGKGSVRVSKAVVDADPGYTIGPTKTPQSRRTVEFSEAIVSLMRRHRKTLAEERLGARQWEEKGFVFPNSKGGFLTRHVLGRHFAPIRDAAGLQGHSFRDFRHTFATLLFERGTHPKIVQEALGHTSIRVTLDIYSHYVPQMEGGISDSLSDVFGSDQL